jgi:hypothetical protein
MSTQEIANRFYELAQQGQWNDILDKYFSEDASSTEPAHAQGFPTKVQGMENIKAKGKQWAEMVEEAHGGFCKEPQVGGNFFACAMGMDVTLKGQGRQQMDEIALYEVKDGKIISEQFFY